MFVSAKFVENTEPDGRVSTDRLVEALDEDGSVWRHSVDNLSWRWLKYLEGGGAVTAYDAAQEQPT